MRTHSHAHAPVRSSKVLDHVHTCGHGPVRLPACAARTPVFSCLASGACRWDIGGRDAGDMWVVGTIWVWWPSGASRGWSLDPYLGPSGVSACAWPPIVYTNTRARA